jgi:hypothetical protein
VDPVVTFDEHLVDSWIAGQFGVKGTCPHWPRTTKDRSVVNGSKNFNAGTDALDDWSPYEDGVDRMFWEAYDVDIRLERLDLTPESVAAYIDVDGAKASLVGAWTEDALGEQNHARARSQHRHPVLDSPVDHRKETCCFK